MLQRRERTIRDQSAGGSDRWSAELIEARVQASLQESRYQTIRRVQYKLLDGVLTLRGRVPSYYEKQLAQELVRGRLNGAVVIRNEVEVMAAGGSRPHGTAEAQDQTIGQERGERWDDGY